MSFDDTNAATSADGIVEETVAELSPEVVAVILGFLSAKDIMRARVCKTWRDAAKKTVVPTDCCFVNYGWEDGEAYKYNAIGAMSTALPNLQLLQFGYHIDDVRCKFNDGEDPDEAPLRGRYHDEASAETTNYRTSYDISIISNFRQLRILDICKAPLNGRYPALFNFPLLEKLFINDCYHLKWNLEMLSGGFPQLKEMFCYESLCPTGNLRDLRVLKNTLEKFEIFQCYESHGIEGDFMDLADFPHLKELIIISYVSVSVSGVTGDIRKIRSVDFPAMERLILPDTVVGGCEYQFGRISDVPSFIQAIYPLLKRRILYWNPWNDDNCYTFDDSGDVWNWKLSDDSPDWYGGNDNDSPFYIRFVQAGSRLGWTWHNDGNTGSYEYCEINWLDPEPSRDSSDYETYIEELQCIKECIDFYKGCHEPPTEQEYWRRWHAQWEHWEPWE